MKWIQEKMAIPLCIADYNIQIVLRAVFLLAFSAFWRLGEILVRSSQDRNKVVQVQGVQILYENGKPVNLVLTLRHSKTITHNQPITISLSSNTQQPQFCPVTALHNYVSILSHSLATYSSLFRVHLLPTNLYKINYHLFWDSWA